MLTLETTTSPTVTAASSRELEHCITRLRPAHFGGICELSYPTVAGDINISPQPEHVANHTLLTQTLCSVAGISSKAS